MSWRPSNVVLYLCVEATYVALLALVARAPFGIAATILVVAGLLTLPMLPPYLAIVRQIPAGWSRKRQRLAAMAASPILLTLFAFVFGVWHVPSGLGLLLVALPGALTFGALVRLRAKHDPPGDEEPLAAVTNR